MTERETKEIAWLRDANLWMARFILDHAPATCETDDWDEAIERARDTIKEGLEQQKTPNLNCDPAMLSLINLVTRFTIENPSDSTLPLHIEKRGPGTWVICSGATVLNRNNAWEFEPLPSNRTTAFIERTRFSLEEALQRAELCK